jgi:hypothetical protein
MIVRVHNKPLFATKKRFLLRIDNSPQDDTNPVDNQRPEKETTG